MSEKTSSPGDAEIVVIGGGAVGCGVAYSLALAGKTDVLLIERAPDLGEVTTSQGAGLCGQVRSTIERTRLAMRSVEMFNDLQATSAVKPDWHPVGSLRIALSERVAADFENLARVARGAGLEVELLDVDAAKRLWPLLDWRAVKGTLWCPTDGYMNPRSVVKAYEHRSRELGVRFAVDTAVEDLVFEKGRLRAVETSRGTVRCRLAVNAAGSHAYHVARLAGLELPIVPVRHEYFVSAAVDGLDPGFPCFRVPEMTLYGRVAGGALLLGGWESRALHTDPRSYGMKTSPPEIIPDGAVLDDFAARFESLFPGTKALEHARVGKGWPTFTPDGRFIVGESSRAPGFVMAGGCNAHGISGSRGIGCLLVESLLETKPSDYVRSLGPDRFTETDWDWETAQRQARAVYETYYAC